MPNIHKLNNGMTLITDHVNTVETVSVGMWNKVGARNERKEINGCLLYTSPSPRDGLLSRMPSSA